MSDQVELTCGACEREWWVRRSRGSYPRLCPSCQDVAGRSEPAARRRAGRLRAHGLNAGAIHRPGQEWVVLVTTPWHHGASRTVVDEVDEAWLLSELAEHQAVAA